MNYFEIFAQIQSTESFLCVGLDSDINKLPKHLLEYDDPQFEFNKAIINATAPYCIAYKPNLAFYEALRGKGWGSFEKTVLYIKENHPEKFIIADAKRGDIGNTSELYARAFFDSFPVDAITVAPYMGEDSVKPFLRFDGKWVILLALTSNKGSQDFQHLTVSGEEQNRRLFEQVLQTSQNWADKEQMMYVVGTTQAAALKQIRDIVPDHFLLVPGIGAQGGNLEEVAHYGMNKNCGLIVNASRSIIFAGKEKDFAAKAAEEAAKVQQEMASLLKQYGII